MSFVVGLVLTSDPACCDERRKRPDYGGAGASAAVGDALCGWAAVFECVEVGKGHEREVDDSVAIGEALVAKKFQCGFDEVASHDGIPDLALAPYGLHRTDGGKETRIVRP